MEHPDAFQPDETETNALRKEVLELAGIGLYRYAFDGTILSIDRASIRIFELDEQFPDPHSVIGKNIAYLIVHIGSQRAMLDESRICGRVHNYEYAFRTLRGHRKWVLYDSYVLHDSKTGQQIIQAIIRDITQRKEIEEALREKEAYLRTFMQNLPFDFWAMGRDGRYMLQSQTSIGNWGDIVGLRPEDIPAPSAVRAIWQESNERAFRGELVQHEAEIPVHGEMRNYIEIVAPVRSDDRIIGILGANIDITERKRAEETLRRAEEQYRSIFENAGIGIFRSSPEGRFLRVNPAMAQIFGYASPDNFLQSISNIATQIYLDPHRRAEVLEMLRRSHGIVRVENQFRRRDGATITANMIIRTVRDDKGHLLYFEGFLEDITERKRAEEALERERAYLSAAIDIMPFPIAFVTSTDGHRQVSRANRAMKSFFHLDDSPQWWNVQILSPETRVPIPEEQWPVNRALHGKVMLSMEGVIALSDGRHVPVLMHAAPIYVGEELVAAVVAFQDITELKAADRAKNEFLAVLSHELKTPLTSILGWTQAARDGDCEAVKEALVVIERNAQRQRHILDDLLDVSRIVYGKVQLQLDTVDLWTLVEQCVEDMRLSFTEHQLTLRITPPHVPLPVYVDASRMRQVIINLLNNAVKFTPLGGEITVRGLRREGWAVFSVHDTGRGIPPEMIGTLFRPFRQLQRTEQIGGLGLGLALAKGLVELHHGRILAESPGLGQGSTFTVQIPIIPTAWESPEQ